MRLYVIVQKALSTGLKIAQACHALRQFTEAYPEIDRTWFEHSNNIVILEHDDLLGKSQLLKELGFAVAEFREPDLNDELTAICVEPSAGKRLSNLKLAS